MGRIFGLFDATVWAENSYWFEAVLLGGPLGLVGAIARQADALGLAARLLVPVGAVLEPFVLGMFTQPAMMPWPDQVASVVSGLILLLGGIAGGAAVLARARRSRRGAKAPT